MNMNSSRKSPKRISSADSPMTTRAMLAWFTNKVYSEEGDCGHEVLWCDVSLHQQSLDVEEQVSQDVGSDLVRSELETLNDLPYYTTTYSSSSPPRSEP